MKKLIPWWAKIGSKLFLSRLPFDYSVWQRLGLFRLGAMDTSTYAFQVFDNHVKRASLEDSLSGKTILELGPGDSISSAIIAKAYGATAILVDAGRFAREDLSPYLNFVEFLASKGLNPPDISDAKTLEDILQCCGAHYLTDGLNSLRSLSATSVDFIYSEVVLEHIRKAEFLEMMHECCRILKHQGVASHCIDLKDHLGGSLNNLRFSESLWESDFFATSGFYTNRIQKHDMLAFFMEAGFEILWSEVERWPSLPIERHYLSDEFRHLSDEALNVSGLDVLLRPAESSL